MGERGREGEHGLCPGHTGALGTPTSSPLQAHGPPPSSPPCRLQQATNSQAHLEQQLGLASARVTQAHKVLAAVKGEAERWGVAGAEMEDKHQQVGGGGVGGSF